MSMLPLCPVTLIMSSVTSVTEAVANRRPAAIRALRDVGVATFCRDDSLVLSREWGNGLLGLL